MSDGYRPKPEKTPYEQRVIGEVKNTRITQVLTAVAPDGTEVQLKTSGGYQLAALARDSRGWYIAAKGFSADSVRSRGRSRAYGRNVTVVAFLDRVQLRAYRYFTKLGGSIMNPYVMCGRVSQVFAPPEEGKPADWLEVDLGANEHVLKALRATGAERVSITRNGRTADFSVRELLAPVKAA